MKIKDLWTNCPIFMNVKSGKFTFAYKFTVEGFDPQTKLFTVLGQQDPLKGFDLGIVKVEQCFPLATFKRFYVNELFFAKMSSLPRSLDTEEGKYRGEYELALEKWRAAYKADKVRRDQLQKKALA